MNCGYRNQISFDHRSWEQFKQFLVSLKKSGLQQGSNIALPVRRSNQLCYEATED